MQKEGGIKYNGGEKWEMRENEMTRERNKLGEAQIEGVEREGSAKMSLPVFSGKGGARERGRKDLWEEQRWRCTS